MRLNLSARQTVDVRFWRLQSSPARQTVILILWVLYSAQYHRQHCTLRDFEQFGGLYMHNHDDKYMYPTRPGFEPGTSRLQASLDTNESSGLALKKNCPIFFNQAHFEKDGPD